ncbi:hypothetical protein BXY57_1792 [Thermoflavifilum aggregans]|uniref:NurA domain-containing protein n=1 Tax=Thermoflavifilum aggregans TaxID=454188 RepID=A0A2M9CWA0_9BACT|nr:hypothetical protein [Thermoflavifilum aggregans]PJJ76186.1 hypothetical protein BXY57_1792 [Thermoflavifilum aggregans]
MALAESNFEEIKKRVFDAYKNEEPVLYEFREFAKRLKNDIKRIKPYSVNAVSFVSSDGGDNRLYFNPATVELVRVVDSLGNQCALDAIASNSKASELNTRVDTTSPLLVQPLLKLCQDLNTDVVGLSYLLKGLGEPGKSTGAVRIYRDIVEWAVLYDLMKYREWGSDTIIVREGMLRTKSFKRDIFPEIDRLIRKAYEDHKKKNITVSLVGVAKQSAVLSRLAVALELEETFHKKYPCYVQVPKDIEEKCYNFDRTWLNTLETSQPYEEGRHLYQSMGKLFLVKFGDRPFDPVWPVDIAEWQVSEADKIIGQLTKDAQPGFPIPDFPMCVQKAHDLAKVNGLEVDILQDILFDGITQNLTPTEKEKVLRIKLLGQNLTNIRYRNA